MSKDKGPEGPDEPRIVEEAQIPGRKAVVPAERVAGRTCKVHRTRIEGLGYFCPSCKSSYCTRCVQNVLLPERKCLVCGSPVEIADDLRAFAERAASVAGPEGHVPEGKVTMLAPEVLQRLEGLGLDEDVLDELIERLKYVPPEDRLKYLDAIFPDENGENDSR